MTTEEVVLQMVNETRGIFGRRLIPAVMIKLMDLHNDDFDEDVVGAIDNLAATNKIVEVKYILDGDHRMRSIFFPANTFILPGGE